MLRVRILQLIVPLYVDFDKLHVVYSMLLSHHQATIMERLSYIVLLNSEDMRVRARCPSLSPVLHCNAGHTRRCMLLVQAIGSPLPFSKFTRLVGRTGRLDDGECSDDSEEVFGTGASDCGWSRSLLWCKPFWLAQRSCCV